MPPLLENDMKELAKRLHRINDDELAQQPGMVYQAWSDGEITLTKSGRLLGRRNLHCIIPGMAVRIPKEYFPHGNGEYGYCYTTNSGADLIREIVRQFGQ